MVLNILELKQKSYNDSMHILHLSDTGTILVKQSWQYWIHYFKNQVSRIKFRMQDTILHFILNTPSSMGALYCMMLPQAYSGM